MLSGMRLMALRVTLPSSRPYTALPETWKGMYCYVGWNLFVQKDFGHLVILQPVLHHLYTQINKLNLSMIFLPVVLPSLDKGCVSLSVWHLTWLIRSRMLRLLLVTLSLSMLSTPTWSVVSSHSKLLHPSHYSHVHFTSHHFTIVLVNIYQ